MVSILMVLKYNFAVLALCENVTFEFSVMMCICFVMFFPQIIDIISFQTVQIVQKLLDVIILIGTICINVVQKSLQLCVIVYGINA